MPYSTQITRQDPTCFLLLIDQSESMLDPFGVAHVQKTKAEGAADAVNRVLENLLLRCTKGPNDIRDYFYVGAVGYGPGVVPVLTTPDQEPDELPRLIPMSQLPDLVIKLEVRRKQQLDGAGGILTVEEPFPIYVEPVAANGTPMCQALQVGYEIIEAWCKDHPNSFPPTVINITDGEASDGSPLISAQALRGLATNDGNTLLFNCHLSSNPAPAIIFSDTDQYLVDDYARQLFMMSSILPESFQQAAATQGYRVNNRTRGFAFNADLVDLVKFLDVGTRPANMR
ncbi:MAG TPA: vWA domain-containing protein [Chloroflexia bacterium]|nr:vWA domain-containing protein [Chloroflexia bacterium]